MTPPPNRSGRRRRRRGPRPQPDGNQSQVGTQPQPRQEPAQDTGDQVSAPPRDARQPSRQDGGQGAEDISGNARKRTRAKRRPNRQPTVFGPMPSEVLKAPFRRARPTREMARLRLDDVLASEDNGLQFGCPMLTRTRLSLPSSGNLPSPRCSLGWALHAEDEVALCLRTPHLLDCWKLDGRREERLRAELDQEPAAD